MRFDEGSHTKVQALLLPPLFQRGRAAGRVQQIFVIIMRNNFQVDGVKRSVFVTCVALSSEHRDFTRYEQHTGIRGNRLVTGNTTTTEYLFRENDRRVLYLYESSDDGMPSMAAAGVAYSPETPDEMLDEFRELVGLEETDEVPPAFMTRFEGCVRNAMAEYMQWVDRRL